MISQEPITTNDSEPEPDVGIVRGKRRDYTKAHPRPKDIGLIVEVADSTLDRDRGVKKTLYAKSKIPVYWILNLIDRCLEVYSDPTGPSKRPHFRTEEVYGLKDSVSFILDGHELGEIKVKHLFP